MLFPSKSVIEAEKLTGDRPPAELYSAKTYSFYNVVLINWSTSNMKWHQHIMCVFYALSAAFDHIFTLNDKTLHIY